MICKETTKKTNPNPEHRILKIEQVTAIFVDQGATKSHYLKIFKYQYLSEFLRYGPACDHNFYRFQTIF